MPARSMPRSIPDSAASLMVTMAVTSETLTQLLEAFLARCRIIGTGQIHAGQATLADGLVEAD